MNDEIVGFSFFVVAAVGGESRFKTEWKIAENAFFVELKNIVAKEKLKWQLKFWASFEATKMKTWFFFLLLLNEKLIIPTGKYRLILYKNYVLLS